MWPSLLLLLLALIAIGIGRWASWALEKAGEFKACTHPRYDTSYITEVTRCSECGDILENW